MKALSVQLVSQYEKTPSPGYVPVVEVGDVWAGEMAKVSQGSQAANKHPSPQVLKRICPLNTSRNFPDIIKQAGTRAEAGGCKKALLLLAGEKELEA